MKIIKPLIISSIIAFAIWFTNVSFMNKTAYETTVTVINKKRDWEVGKLLVYTTNDTLQCIDQQMLFRFKSGEIFDSIKPGKSYKMKIYGWKFPFFNWYKKIESVQPVN